MPIYIGDNDITGMDEIFVGTDSVSAVYVGDTRVWPDTDSDVVPPTSSTGASSSSQNSISISATVTDDGGEEVTSFVFYYSTSPSVGVFNSEDGTYTGATSWTTVDQVGNNYTSTIFGLSANTQYYWAFVAGNSAGFATSDISTTTTVEDTPPPPPPPSETTYSLQWVNDGGSYRDQEITSAGECEISVTSSTCATDQPTCSVSGTRDIVSDFSNYMIDQTFRCVSSDGIVVSDSLCGSPASIGATRTIDLGYGAETGAAGTQGCSEDVPNDDFQQPETYTAFNSIDFSTITGGETINVVSTGACTVPAGQQTGCAPELSTCPTDNGTRPITYDVTATFADRVYTCRRDSDGAEVFYEFCGLTFDQSQGINEQISPAQTGVMGQTSCSTNYANPDYDPTSIGSCVSYNITYSGSGAPLIIRYTQCDSGVDTVIQFFSNGTLDAIEGTVQVLGGSGGFSQQ